MANEILLFSSLKLTYLLDYKVLNVSVLFELPRP